MRALGPQPSVALPAVETSWDEYRAKLDLLSDLREDWQGIPVYIPGEQILLNDRHPMRERFRELAEHDHPDSGLGEGERIINSWFSHGRHQEVLIVEAKDGHRYPLTLPVSPGRAMERLRFWLRTIGASDAWDLNAEYRAREKLHGLLSDRQFRHYELTGSFLETSPRSGLMYLFRRLRPTLALGVRGRESVTCLAVLCLHPVGYYADTWGGCMVPTDDVIAHLLLCRADEADFWRQANQHKPWRPEAGI